MNDLELLDRFGPTAEPLDERALEMARSRLETGYTVTPRPLRRPALVLAAAAVLAVVLGVAPAALRSDHSIALAAVDPLTFPVTPTWLPPGLPRPVISGPATYSGTAVYGSRPDQIVLTSTRTWNEWEDPTDVTPVEVDGRFGRIFRGGSQPDSHVTVAWRERDGDIVGVTGIGRYADRAALVRIAKGVVDRPQPVDLFLTVAPRGWPLLDYRSDFMVRYGKRGELSVVLRSSQAGGPADWGHDWRNVDVDGRAGRLGRHHDGWVLLAQAPDGRAFILTAPDSLTSDQVIRIAAGVRHR